MPKIKQTTEKRILLFLDNELPHLMAQVDWNTKLILGVFLAVFGSALGIILTYIATT